mgnify:CR=1 FL=1
MSVKKWILVFFASLLGFAALLALFNAALLAIYALLLFVFVMPDLQQEAQSWTALLLVAFFVLGNVSFLLYDVVLGRIADLYVRRLRPKLFRRGL